MNGEPAFRISYLRIRFSLIAVGLGMLIFAMVQSPTGWLEHLRATWFVRWLSCSRVSVDLRGGFVGLSALWEKNNAASWRYWLRLIGGVCDRGIQRHGRCVWHGRPDLARR
jgi:hypothetical protein